MPEYEVKDGAIVRLGDGKLVANIVDGAVKPTAPIYWKQIDAFREVAGIPVATKEEPTVKETAPREGEPSLNSPLGDRCPDVLTWRRTNWTEEQWGDWYGERVPYKTEEVAQ